MVKVLRLGKAVEERSPEETRQAVAKAMLAYLDKVDALFGPRDDLGSSIGVDDHIDFLALADVAIAAVDGAQSAPGIVDYYAMINRVTPFEQHLFVSGACLGRDVNDCAVCGRAISDALHKEAFLTDASR